MALPNLLVTEYSCGMSHSSLGRASSHRDHLTRSGGWAIQAHTATRDLSRRCVAGVPRCVASPWMHQPPSAPLPEARSPDPLSPDPLSQDVSWHFFVTSSHLPSRQTFRGVHSVSATQQPSQSHPMRSRAEQARVFTSTQVTPPHAFEQDNGGAAGGAGGDGGGGEGGGGEGGGEGGEGGGDAMHLSLTSRIWSCASKKRMSSTCTLPPVASLMTR